MTRIDIDREYKAKTAEQAARKFAKFLESKGYDWAASEIIEVVENGYFCCCNASEFNMVKGEVTSPKSHDWTYYWGIEESCEGEWYCWFIDREYKGGNER